MDKKLTLAMKDFGYEYTNGRLISKGIRGLSSDRVLPYRFRDAFDAAEYLIPIIRDDEYTRRVHG